MSKFILEHLKGLVKELFDAARVGAAQRLEFDIYNDNKTGYYSVSTSKGDCTYIFACDRENRIEVEFNFRGGNFKLYDDNRVFEVIAGLKVALLAFLADCLQHSGDFTVYGFTFMPIKLGNEYYEHLDEYKRSRLYIALAKKVFGDVYVQVFSEGVYIRFINRFKVSELIDYLK